MMNTHQSSFRKSCYAKPRPLDLVSSPEEVSFDLSPNPGKSAFNQGCIGITLDNEDSKLYSKFPWYAIRQNYLHSIEKLGGIPFPLFHSTKSINNILKLIDGIIITGGNFDISPSLYGKKNSGSRIEKNIRTIFEKKICEKSLIKNIPILGICGGHQLINVCLGGTLIQDIKSLKYKTI